MPLTMVEVQSLLDGATPESTIDLPAGEFRVNVVVRRAVRIAGRGRATHLQGAPGTGPTVTVLCDGVVLEDLCVEHLDGVALYCAAGVRPELHNVTVMGRTETAASSTSDSNAAATFAIASAVTSSPFGKQRLLERIDKLLQQGATLEDSQEWASAIRVYDQVLLLAPAHAEALAFKRLAESQQTLGERDTSVANRSAVVSARSSSAPPAAQSRSGGVAGPVVPQRAAPGFVLVPAGEFMMGSPDDEPFRRAIEARVKVTITRPFLVATHLTTQDAFMGAMGKNPSTRKMFNLPVYDVTWHDAVEYANKVSAREGLDDCYDIEGRFLGLDRNGYRLPTSAEWEYFARAGVVAGVYGAIDDICWHKGNADDRPHPTGSKIPNAWGIYDVLGNVWEWTNDRSSSFYEMSAPRGGIDPAGDAKGDHRAIRGGSFESQRADLRFARFEVRDRSSSRYPIGFRLVRTAL